MIKGIVRKYVEHKLNKKQRNPFKTTGFLFRALQFLDGTFIRSRNGVLIQANIRDNTNRLCIFGYGGGEVARAVENLQEGDIFLDIGASYGLFSLLAAKRVGAMGSVLSFEPNGEIFKFLLNDIRSNSASNVIPINIAASDEYSILNLEFSQDHSGMGHLVEKKRGAIQVPTVDVSDFVSRFGLHEGRRVAVKIDVEGHEFAVLKSLMRGEFARYIFMIICEINDEYLNRYGVGRDDIYRLMEKNNFSATIRADVEHADEVFIKNNDDN